MSRTRSAALVLAKRDIHFDIAGSLTDTWLDGHHMRTAYCDALSALFPEGERFFIRSVTPYIPLIKDPVLKEQARAFIVQEALHTREHEAYNQALVAGGCDVAAMEARVAVALERVKTPLIRLATTVAVEHLTATFAQTVLDNPKVLASAPAALRDLWNWHALEEMEHKAVAFDIYLIATADMTAWKRYALRCAVLIAVSRDIHAIHIANFRQVLEERGQPTGFGAWVKGLWNLIVAPGYYLRALPHYLRFFRPGFHPWDTAEVKAAAGWRERFRDMMEQAS